MRKSVLKQNQYRKDFRLIEYREDEYEKVIVVNTVEKEEIFS